MDTHAHAHPLPLQAYLDSLAEILRRCGPDLTHIVLASGHDVPLRPLAPGVLQPGVTLFGSYDYDPSVQVRAEVKMRHPYACFAPYVSCRGG